MGAPITESSAAAPAAAAAPSSRARLAWRLAGIVLLLATLYLLTDAGIAYRRRGWDFMAVARFRGDIGRNYRFGEAALDNGFLNIHENQLRDNPPRDQKLDYPPLRLLTFEAWAAWMHAQHPGEDWNESYAFHAPLMRYYTALEWLAAAAAFGIVWHWRRRCAQASTDASTDAHPLAPAPGPWTGIIRATAAFALLWFDPGVLIIGHGWPSPNIWSLTFYLWPVLLCLLDFWFIAGLVLAIGAMMQGQLLSVVAVFLLWPLFAWQPVRLFRWVGGFALGFMAVASPWMLSIRPDPNAPGRIVNWLAVAWIGLAMAMLILVCLRANLGKRVPRHVFLAPAAVAAIILVLPATGTQPPAVVVLTVLAAGGLVALFWFVPWSFGRYLLALTLAAMLLLCIPFFHAGTAWWEVGFLYGAERFPQVASELTSNLSTLLHQFLGWQLIQDHAITIPSALIFGWPAHPIDWDVRQFTGALFAILIILNGFFIARQWRRRRLNLLIALVLPWVLFFTVLPQMSPRYAVFAAGVGAICIGHSFGMTLLTWFFSFLTVIQTALCMMLASRRFIRADPNWLFNEDTRALFATLIPSLAWAEVLACLVFIFVAFNLARPLRRPRPSIAPPPRPLPDATDPIPASPRAEGV